MDPGQRLAAGRGRIIGAERCLESALVLERGHSFEMVLVLAHQRAVEVVDHGALDLFPGLAAFCDGGHEAPPGLHGIAADRLDGGLEALVEFPREKSLFHAEVKQGLQLLLGDGAQRAVHRVPKRGNLAVQPGPGLGDGIARLAPDQVEMPLKQRLHRPGHPVDARHHQARVHQVVAVQHVAQPVDKFRIGRRERRRRGADIGLVGAGLGQKPLADQNAVVAQPRDDLGRHRIGIGRVKEVLHAEMGLLERPERLEFGVFHVLLVAQHGLVQRVLEFFLVGLHRLGRGRDDAQHRKVELVLGRHRGHRRRARIDPLAPVGAGLLADLWQCDRLFERHIGLVIGIAGATDARSARRDNRQGARQPLGLGLELGGLLA